MNEDAARAIMAKLGIAVLSRSQTGWLQAHCPLAPYTHRKGTDRKPAFAIKCDDAGVSVYKCLACHYKGRVSQLVRTLEEFQDHDYPGLALEADMADAAGAFGGGFDVTKTMVGFEDPEPIDEHAIKGAYPPAYSIHAAAAYLDGRGISGGTAEALGLCFDPEDMRVMFPVRGRRRELYGFTGRTILSPEQFPYRRYPKVRDYLGLPKRSLLLGLEGYQPGKPFFATEGLIGYARLVENGVREICNPVALLGSEMTPQKASILAEFDERVYLMSDPDEAGDSCLWGHIDESTNDHNGDGAVYRLRRKGLSVFIPEWPAHTQGDIDRMTFDDVQDILLRCPVYLEDG